MCARLSLSVVFYQFGLKADRLPWPILIGICDQDLLWFNENGHQGGGREDSTSTALRGRFKIRQVLKSNTSDSFD
jgi:hypothetical protein